MISGDEGDNIDRNDTRGTEVFQDFKLKGALLAPRTVNLTTKELREQIKDQTIDLNPEYQRGVVWSAQKQTALIDSIFKNFYVPPIILAVKHAEDGTESKVCIDGKQRLTAIDHFLGGIIHYQDTETKARLYYTDNGDGRSRKRLLPDRYKRLFASRQIVCVEYSGLEEKQIRDMFQRVQAGMSLNTAERMQAIESAMTDFIKDLDQTYFFGQRLGVTLHLNDQRSRTFQNIGQFLWMFDRWPGRSTAPTRKELHDWLDSQKGPSDYLYQKSHATLTYFSKLVKDARYLQRFWRKEIFAPVEFIFSSLLIALHMDQLEMEEIARGIGLMRWEVRLMYPGQVRTNKHCCTLMAEFVTDLTSHKMDLKEQQLEALQTVRLEEEERHKEQRRNSNQGVSNEPPVANEDGEDDIMEVDFPHSSSSKKRRRVQVGLDSDTSE